MLLTIRFIQHDLDAVKQNLEREIKEQNENVENLKKKQHYLDTTFKNAQSHINEILGRR